MPTLKATVIIEKDGVVIHESVRRVVVDEIQTFAYDQQGHGNATSFSAVPASEMDELQMLLLQSDSQVTLRLDGQSDAGIVLAAGGLIVLIGVDIDAGAGADNAKLNYNAGASLVASVSGLAGGT